MNETRLEFDRGDSRSIWKTCLIVETTVSDNVGFVLSFSAKTGFDEKPLFQNISGPSPSYKILEITVEPYHGLGKKSITYLYLPIKSR